MLLRRGLGAGDYLRRRRIDAFHQFLDLLAADMLHLDPHLVRTGEEWRVLQGQRKSLAQGAYAFDRDAGRREERAAHLLRREQEFEHLAVVGRLGVVDDGRKVGQFRVLLERHLVKYVDLLVLEPVTFAQLEEGPADS